MTPYLFLLGFVTGTALTFLRHPIYGLYTYLFTFYMAPSDSWFRNEIPDLRYLLLIGTLTVIATLRMPPDTARAKWHQTGAARLFLLFVIYNWLLLAWAVDFDWQLEGALLFTKHAVAFYLFYRLADSVERVMQIAVVHVIGCAWFGYQAMDAGAGRLESVGGAVAGANELGIHAVTGLLFGGMLLFAVRGVQRWVLFGGLPLIANCLVLTVSRGAFVGLMFGGIASYVAIPRGYKKVFAICAILGILLFGLLAHNTLIERFTTTYAALRGEVELDRSAISRTEIAKAGFRIALDYPFGAGFRGTGVLSPQYMDESLLGSTGLRTAHNTSAAVVAEQGFVGLALYYLLILWVLSTMLRMRRAGTSNDSLHGLCMTFAGGSLLAIYAAGNFSNNIGTETQYWCLALLASAAELQKAAARNATLPQAPHILTDHPIRAART